MNNLQNEIDAKTEETASGCMVIFCLLILAPFGTWWSSYVLLKIYNWFILPIQGAPVLTLGNMVGVGCIVAMFTLPHIKGPKTNEDTWANVFSEAVVRMITYPLIMLFFGWLYQRLFM